MPAAGTVGWGAVIAHNRGLIFPVLIVASVLILVAPLPPVMLDLLLACNVTVAVVILLTTIYVARPLEFSVFPTILLGTTLVRLVLNVASTRLILTGAKDYGTRAAGGVIEAFGQFVSGDNIVVGLIIFIILIVIQFVVITKGATRISEVTARFALDGMPGKQMAIDADLNAGLITQEVAKHRREEITEQADFYGAMDGASKFVRGDAVAGIIITVINIVGGLYVGMVEHGMGFGEAVKVFTTLTIGDGLVSQVPGFLISLAAGLIVTRTSMDSDLPRQVLSQLFGHPEAMLLSSGFLILLATTGLPALPLLALSAACGATGWNLLRSRKANTVHEERQVQEQAAAQRKEEDRPENNLQIDLLELDLTENLVCLVDPNSGGELIERIVEARHGLAYELGIIMPNVRIRDNAGLGFNTYQIKVRGVPVLRNQLIPKGFQAMNKGAATGHVPGWESVEPLNGATVLWIEPRDVERARLLGYEVIDPATVLTTHIMAMVRQHADELLTREQVHVLLDNLKKVAPKTVEELVPEQLKVAQVHQVLCNLLREEVPIRDLESILTSLGNYASRTQNLELLTEYARMALMRTICQQYRDDEGVLHAITLDPIIENMFDSSRNKGEVIDLNLHVSPQIVERFLQTLEKHLQALLIRGYKPVVVCSPLIRKGLKTMTEDRLPKLAVLSTNEITRDTQLESLGQVGKDELIPVAAAAGSQA